MFYFLTQRIIALFQAVTGESYLNQSQTFLVESILRDVFDLSLPEDSEGWFSLEGSPDYDGGEQQAKRQKKKHAKAQQRRPPISSIIPGAYTKVSHTLH